MPLDQKAVIKQIDDILAKYDPSSGCAAEMSKTLSLFLSTIRKLAPPGSVYSNTAGDYEPHLSSGVLSISMALVLKALNMHEILTIKDPLLTPVKKNSYFL